MDMLSLSFYTSHTFLNYIHNGAPHIQKPEKAGIVWLTDCPMLTQIPTGFYLYLIAIGNEGRV
jgi:hypothetical protein